jgi:hypothetical protein
LDKTNGAGFCPLTFRVPKYLQSAIEYVAARITPIMSPAETSDV